MSDINKFTTKEVLNKVLLDSSGDAVAAFSHTTQEAFNAALDDANSRLNVSLVGGTIGGDVTISGDLTVNGDSVANISETIQGDMKITSSATAHPILTLEQTGNHANAGQLIFLTSGAATNNDDSGVIRFKGMNNASTPEELEYATIFVNHSDIADGSEDAEMHFRTVVNGALDSRLTISAGNVGIGATDIPSALFIARDQATAFNGATDDGQATVGSTITIANNNTGANTFAQLNFQVSASSGRGVARIVGIREASQTSALAFVTENSNTASEKMRINGAGNVGIGMTPAGMLDIQATDNLKLRFYNSTTFKAGLELATSSNDMITGSAVNDFAIRSQSNLLFSSGGATERMRLDTSGNATFGGDIQANERITFTGTNDSIASNTLTRHSNGYLYIAGGSSGLVVGNSDTSVRTQYMSTSMQFETESAVRFKIDSNSRISLSNNDSGTSNTIFGKLAGNSLASGGNNNVLIGENAGDVMTVCDDNVGIGLNAIGQATTQTDRVVAIGSGAMSGGIGTADITGLVAIGYESLAGSLEAGADYTVAVGYQSLKSLTSGAGNTSIGYQSSEDVNTGAYNTVMGYQAFSADTDGSANVAIGWKAGRNIHGSTQNVMIGYKAMANIDNNPADNIANCVAIGYEAFLGSDNDSTGTTTATNGTIAIGHSALKALTEGIGNVAVGFESLKVNTDGDYNTAIGHQALKAQAGQSGTVGNTAVGHGAAETITTSVNITALGFEALSGATTEADGNTAIGFQSMDGNWTTAAHVNSVAVGSKTMRGVLTATSSGTVGIGYQALNALTSGTGVTAAGFQAGQFNTTGASSTFIGYQAGQGVTGAKLTGNANTAIGRQSGFLLQGGAGGNTLLGYLSGDRITTGTNNTILGQGADTDDATATNQAVIGQGAIGVADNSVTLGNASVTAVYIAKGNDTSQDLNFFDSAGGGGNIQYTHVDDQMKFGVADGVRARLFAGSLRPGADDTQDLGTASAAWKTLYVKDGINFPDDASSNPSSDVNTLDSYEEGTWTPVYFNITDDANVTATYDDTKFGFYTKIGRVVTLSCYMRTDALTAPDANDLIGIGGLPFTISAGSDGHSGYPTSRFLITASLWADNPQTISVGESEAFARLNAEVSANSEDDTAVHTLGNDLTAGTSNNKNQLAFSITYQV